MTKLKKYEHLIYSAVGLAALLLLLVALNFLVSRVPARVDLTEGDLYTLSPGTRSRPRRRRPGSGGTSVWSP